MATTLKIEHYLLGKTIGIGASSKVKIARHEYAHSDVAIKIINKKRMKSSNMSAKIKREIRLLRYFNHPNIIRLYTFFSPTKPTKKLFFCLSYEVLETQSDIYVVMEHISGGELFELIAQRGKLSETEARCYFQQIISGVEYCHLNLVAHRDLKPENVLIDESNVVKIADFGLSNLMKDGKFLKTSCGSPNYAAPEVIAGKKYCGVEIDTWSCGVILFAIVAGYLPFDEEHVPALFKKIKDADYHIPSDVPPIVADLIQRMLQADPTKRIKFSSIKKHPWLCDTDRMYMQISLSSARMWFANKLDEEILKKVMQMQFNFQNLKESQIQDSIIKRKDYSFVIGYDLMMNEKIKAQISASYSSQLEEQQKDHEENNSKNTIYDQCRKAVTQDVGFVISNLDKVVEIEQNPQKGAWQYGLIFEAHPRIIMEVLAQTLGELDTTFVVKSAEYKIKCFHKLHKRIYNFGGVIYETIDSGAYFPTGEAPLRNDKFTTSEIIFNIQIYQMPNKIEHLVDIQRTKGQTMVFLDFGQNFSHLLCVNMQKHLAHLAEIGPTNGEANNGSENHWNN